MENQSFHSPRLAKPAASTAFTLIELLAVISVILILVGSTIPLVSYASRKANDSRIRAEIKAIENALETYKADNGSYPPVDSAVWEGTANPTNWTAGCTNASWTNSYFIYQALTTNGPKVYITFRSSQWTTNYFNMRLLKDPYGKLYGYNPVNPVANPGSFDIWSVGADGKSQYPTNMTQNVDDIGNWK